MALTIRILAAGLLSAVVLACESDLPTSPAPTRPAPLTLARSGIDTAVVVSPGDLFILHNTIMPLDTDLTRLYAWEVIDSSTIGGEWTFSLCDPENCRGVNVTQCDFRFTHPPLPGLLYVDWQNCSVDLASVSAGVCSLSMRIFPKDSGDTIYYTVRMRVTPASIALDRAKVDTTVFIQDSAVFTPTGGRVQIATSMTPRDPDTARVYAWQVAHSSAASPTWSWAITDPSASRAPGVTRGEFRFGGGIPGLLRIDWLDSQTDTSVMAAGICSLLVRIFPVVGGDTTDLSTAVAVFR